MIRFEKIDYKGWPNCYRASNGRIDLIVTTDVGPRIIRFGFAGGPNMFKEFDGQIGQTGGDTWTNYGGHRLWHAPEIPPRTTYPDNGPVQFEQHDDFGRVIQPTETTTHIQKEIDIHMDADDAKVTVIHRMRNNGLWPVPFAPWALSVMAAGGTAVIPLPPRQTHRERLLPINTLAMWAYTDMSDSRWTWGRKYILLRQQGGEVGPQKVGAWVADGWGAYINEAICFLKTFPADATATYPDLGSNMEVFTNAAMLEVESLGPLVTLEPGAVIEHTEQWYLFDDVETPNNDAEVDTHILPLVEAIRAEG